MSFYVTPYSFRTVLNFSNLLDGKKLGEGKYERLNGKKGIYFLSIASSVLFCSIFVVVSKTNNFSSMKYLDLIKAGE